jgi:alanyl-tRNA synthetase
MLTHVQLRKKFAEFWKKNNHKEIPPIPLIPQNDPTTLFTGSGMQQLVPYLLGEPHPLGKRIFDIQPCFRSQDIEEVGDNRHTTFFEMMGNWSLGDYFKKEQIIWFWKFLTEEIKLPKESLYVTVFAGDKKNNLTADEESIKVWKSLGLADNHIFQYGPEKNWWSRAGIPDNMPAGEPGGPDSEVFYEFTQITHDKKFGEKCHPNCDCGRFMEIGNSVFMQYKKNKDGTFSNLPAMNVDFGGGIERILAAKNNDPDVFKTDVFSKIISEIEKLSGKIYEGNNKSRMRIIADHLKGATFLIAGGVIPGNKEHGYVLRRLLRRSAIKMYQLTDGKTTDFAQIADTGVLSTYDGTQGIEKDKLKKQVVTIIGEEIKKFNLSVARGLREIKKIEKVNGKIAFDLYQNFGFPYELTEELFREKGQEINKKQFLNEFNKHKELSRSSSVAKFKGGLADHSAQTIKYHTATHLLHQALFDVVGKDVRQEGSNITTERLRFDFASTIKPTKEQIEKVEKIINEKIEEKLSVEFKIIPKSEALKLGAKSFFREKYPDMVKVYFIGNYSKEFCGGPHVTNTFEIGKIMIYKFEKIGSNLYRIYAK